MSIVTIFNRIHPCQPRPIINIDVLFSVDTQRLPVSSEPILQLTEMRLRDFDSFWSMCLWPFLPPNRMVHKHLLFHSKFRQSWCQSRQRSLITYR